MESSRKEFSTNVNDLPNEVCSDKCKNMYATTKNMYHLQILDIIFSFCDFEDRKTCSVVCKKWLEIVFSCFHMNNVILNIHGLPDDSKNRVLKFNILRPYVNLRAINITNEHIACILTKALKWTSKTLKKLEISLSKNSKINDFYEVLKCVQSIEELSIILENKIDFNMLKYTKGYSKLPTLDNLKVLTIVDDIKFYDENTGVAIVKLSEIAKNVEALHLHRHIDESYRNHSFLELIKAYSGQLKILSCYTKCYTEIYHLEFPKLENLDLLSHDYHSNQWNRHLQSSDHKLYMLLSKIGQNECLKKLKVNVLYPYSMKDTSVFNQLMSVEELSIQLNVFKNLTNENVIPNLRVSVNKRLNSYTKLIVNSFKTLFLFSEIGTGKIQIQFSWKTARGKFL